MKLLTEKQKTFLEKRKIKTNDIYMFPIFGFNAYEKPCITSNSLYIDSNPWGKNLNHKYFYVKRIENGFAVGNFHEKPFKSDFCIMISTLEKRSFIEKFFLSVFTILPMIIYNDLITNSETVKRIVSYIKNIKVKKDNQSKKNDIKTIVTTAILYLHHKNQKNKNDKEKYFNKAYFDLNAKYEKLLKYCQTSEPELVLDKYGVILEENPNVYQLLSLEIKETDYFENFITKMNIHANNFNK